MSVIEQAQALIDDGATITAEDIMGWLYAQQAEIERLNAIINRSLSQLEDTIDGVSDEYYNNWRHGIPTRADQLQGYKDSLDQHVELINELKQEQSE